MAASISEGPDNDHFTEELASNLSCRVGAQEDEEQFEGSMGSAASGQGDFLPESGATGRHPMLIPWE